MKTRVTKGGPLYQKDPWIPPPAKTSKGRRRKVSSSTSAVKFAASRNEPYSDLEAEQWISSDSAPSSPLRSDFLPIFSFLPQKNLLDAATSTEQHRNVVQTQTDSIPDKEVENLKSEVINIKTSLELERLYRDVGQIEDYYETFLQQMIDKESFLSHVKTELEIMHQQIQAFKSSLQLLDLHKDGDGLQLELSRGKLLELQKKAQKLNDLILKLKDSVKNSDLSSIQATLKYVGGTWEKFLTTLNRMYSGRAFDPDSSSSDNLIKCLRSSSLNKDKELADLRSEISHTRRLLSAHENKVVDLEKQVRVRETEIERLQSELRRKSTATSEQQHGISVIMNQMQDKFKAEKDALKKAVRIQKQRGDGLEGQVQNLTEKLQRKESQVNDLILERDHWKTDLRKLADEKFDLEQKLYSLKRDFMELEARADLLQTHRKRDDKDPEKLWLRDANLRLQNDLAHAKTEVLRLQRGVTETQPKTYIQHEEERPSPISKLLSVEKDRDSKAVIQLLQLLRSHLRLVKEHQGDIKQKEVTSKLNEISEKLEKQLIQMEEKDLGFSQNPPEKYSPKLESLEKRLQESQNEVKQLRKMLMSDDVGSKFQEKLDEVDQSMSDLRLIGNCEADALSPRIQSLQEKLDQAITSNKSLNNYISLLRSSYAQVFKDSLIDSYKYNPSGTAFTDLG